MSTRTLVLGSIVIIIMMWVMLTFKPMQGADTNWYQNLLAGIFVVVFGFLFVTVASRISGLLGNSSNPVSGMSIATLMATCGIFFVAGWTAPNYAVLALTIGGVVCIAAAIAGATSQDLKTGYLVGSTPFKQQLSLLIGVTVSTIAIGGTLKLMNTGLERYIPTQIPVNIQSLPIGVQVERNSFTYQGKDYILINSLGSHQIPDGEYLYDRNSKQIEVQWAQGIGSDKAPAPQARLMATVINGILNQRLPWRLVFMGVAMVIAVEILGVRSLAFAVGSYLSYRHYGGDVCGRVGALADRIEYQGQIIGERGQPWRAICQRIDCRRRRVWLAGDCDQFVSGSGFEFARAALAGSSSAFAVESQTSSHRPEVFPGLSASSFVGVVMFVLLAASLFISARKKLN